MRNLFLTLLMMLVLFPVSACSADTKLKEEQTNSKVIDRKVLVAYFSWGGNTQQVAENIAEHTGGTLFRIET